MSRTFMGAMYSRAALLTVLATMAACEPNGVSFFIVQNQTPMMSGTSAQCMTQPDMQGLHRNDGVMDVSVRTNYILYPLYRSELISNAFRPSGMPEERGLIVDGADVELHFDTPDGGLINLSDDGGPVPARYAITTNTYVDPASSSGPGLATGTLEIIPGRIGAALRATYCQGVPNSFNAACPVPQFPPFARRYIAVIRPHGHTMGGVQVGGSTFNFPITFCCHCLVDFSSSDVDTTLGYPNCSGTMGTAIPPCDPGQDFEFNCHACSGNNVAACQPRGFQAIAPIPANPNACPL